MRRKQWAVGLVVVATATTSLFGVCLAGTAPKAKTKPATAAPKAAAKATRPAPPDWFPKHPSPEFLRAAKVLKPVPESADAAAYARHPERRAERAAFNRTLPAAWEVFGATMTEAHIRVLRSAVNTKHPDGSDRAAWDKWAAGQPRVPIKTLTRRQRALVDNYLEVYRRNSSDWLVHLYKEGAKEDLSNVAIGFFPDNSHYIGFHWWIDRGDGKGWTDVGNTDIAMM